MEHNYIFYSLFIVEKYKLILQCFKRIIKIRDTFGVGKKLLCISEKNINPNHVSVSRKKIPP